MAIFKYKKPNDSGGYSIEEMPVISNTYTEYVVTEDISEDPQIVLRPSQTSFNINEQKTFNKVTASIDLLSTTPTYTYNINDRTKTITFNSTEWKTTLGYGDKFPAAITISIPNNRWLNKNTDASSPPATLTISNKTDTIPVPAGYYPNDFEIKLSDTAKGQIVSNNILYNTTIMGVTGTNTNNRNTALTIVSSPTSSNKSGAAAAQILENYQAWVNGSLISGSIVKRGNIKDQTQIKPSNYSSIYYNTGYYTGGSTNGKINIATNTNTITLTTNNKTYTYADWGDSFPTSIKVQVPSDLPAASSPPSTTTITTQNGSIKINAGYYTSDITITATLPSSTVPSDATISTPSETVTIPAGYLSSDVTVTSNITNNGAPGTQLLMPRSKTSYPIYEGYYSSDFTVSPSIQFLTVTNPSLTYNSSTGYYEKSYEPTSSASSSTVWGDKYLVGFTLQLSSNTSSKIVSGQSVCGISGTHVCSDGGIDEILNTHYSSKSLFEQCKLTTASNTTYIDSLLKWRRAINFGWRFTSTSATSIYTTSGTYPDSYYPLDISTRYDWTQSTNDEYSTYENFYNSLGTGLSQYSDNALRYPPFGLQNLHLSALKIPVGCKKYSNIFSPGRVWYLANNCCIEACTITLGPKTTSLQRLFTNCYLKYVEIRIGQELSGSYTGNPEDSSIYSDNQWYLPHYMFVNCTIDCLHIIPLYSTSKYTIKTQAFVSCKINKIFLHKNSSGSAGDAINIINNISDKPWGAENSYVISEDINGNYIQR